MNLNLGWTLVMYDVHCTDYITIYLTTDLAIQIMAMELSQ